MKISLFLLISTIICLYFSRVSPVQSTSSPTSVSLTEDENRLTEPVNKSKDVSELEEDLVIIEETSETEDSVIPEEGTEEYLEFVRKQMQESIKEHLQNIQEKLGEEYGEEAETLILL